MEDVRFAFGSNWKDFVSLLTPAQVDLATQSLRDLLAVETLQGKRFLDVGSGSGLFSVAARRLGAAVRSFDFDQDSVHCTQHLRHRFDADDPAWQVEQGSILDETYVASLGTFDVVYSWGVLHHTGNMAAAFEAIAGLVAPGGTLCISIYNDQGMLSRYWHGVKRLYNRGPALRWVITIAHSPIVAARFLARLATGRRQLERGMSLWIDLRDWLGGYPFEVAAPGGVISTFERLGFRLVKLRDVGARSGCNEFVFGRVQEASRR